ncbi:MAG: AMP-binding protein [Actinomycetota bacterium]|nr:AMP-binding protein [Actinomycetota bacterium]
MSSDDRPWLAAYDPGVPPDLVPELRDGLAILRDAVRRRPDAVAVAYFDGRLTVRELDEASDALASAFLAAGLQRGERVAAYLQSVPQFVVTLLATWKAGGVLVPVSPMSRSRELTHLLTDSGAAVLVCLDDLYGDVARDVVPGTAVRLVVTTSPLEHQTLNDPRLFQGRQEVRHERTADLAELVEQHRGQRPPDVALQPDDVALLTYTSGTTGTPKGAMNTHGNLAFSAAVVRDWCRLTPDDVVLGAAPLFHITGLVCGIAVSLLLPAPLVLLSRFDPAVALDALREHRPTFTVAALTAYVALAGVQGITRDDVASLRAAYSGGAPVTPAWTRRFAEQLGLRVRPIYGLTETTSPSHAVPLGAEPPVDPATGALAVGVPVPSTRSWVVDEDRRPLPPGEVGEIVVAGPQVVPGYWGRPDETEHTMPAGVLHTGDVGVRDERGFFYVVDRKKDMINASGYKVWPREVEDVLAEHEAVAAAAVVGVPDDYRGETVHAFVVLRAGAAVPEQELVAYCRARLAAYKVPRRVEFRDALPTSAAGKLLRRELRAEAPGG